MYEELCSKIRGLVRSTNNHWYDYGEEYLKIKFKSDENLPSQKH